MLSAKGAEFETLKLAGTPDHRQSPKRLVQYLLHTIRVNVYDRILDIVPTCVVT